MNQLFMKDKPLLKDKAALASYILAMDKRLSSVMGNETVDRQLLFCSAIRSIRKAALETSAILSDTEIERVLKRLFGEA